MSCTSSGSHRALEMSARLATTEAWYWSQWVRRRCNLIPAKVLNWRSHSVHLTDSSAAGAAAPLGGNRVCPGGPAIRGPWVFLPFFFSLFVPPGCPPRGWQPRGGGLLLPPFTRAWMNLSLQLTHHPALRPTRGAGFSPFPELHPP